MQRFSTCLITLMVVGLANVPSQPQPIVPIALTLPDHHTASFRLANSDYNRLIDMGRRRAGSGHRPRIS
ncbi:MAG: hypothetical protein ACKO5P_10775 [Nodosilinea sp.]